MLCLVFTMQQPFYVSVDGPGNYSLDFYNPDSNNNIVLLPFYLFAPLRAPFYSFYPIGIIQKTSAITLISRSTIMFS